SPLSAAGIPHSRGLAVKLIIQLGSVSLFSVVALAVPLAVVIERVLTVDTVVSHGTPNSLYPLYSQLPDSSRLIVSLMLRSLTLSVSVSCSDALYSKYLLSARCPDDDTISLVASCRV